ALRITRGQLPHAPVRLAHGERVPPAQIEPRHAVSERRLVEARPSARLADGVLAVAREQHAHVHLVRPRLEPLEPGAHARVLPVVPASFAVDDRGALFRGELLPGDLERDLLLLAELLEDPALPRRARPAPGTHRATADRLARVRDDLVPVDGDDAP